MEMSDNKLIATVMIAFFSLMALLVICETFYPANLPEKTVPQCVIDHHEYQIELEFDTVLIYDNNRFVGSYYIIGDSLTQFETILADDNR